MKKTAIIAGLLLAMGTTAQAFDCAEGGYSVNDKKALATFQSQKTFGMFNNENEASSANMISFLNAEDVKQATEQELSVKKFEELCSQLELLQRSQLKLDRKPVDLVDLEKYAQAQLPGTLIIYNTGDKFADIKPELRLDKIGKNKAITYTYFLKKDEKISSLSNSFLMANDKLYIISTISEAAPAPVEAKDEEEAPEAGKKLKEFKTMPDFEVKEEEAEPAIVPLKADKVEAKLKQELWKKQLAFVKGVKFKTPAEAKKEFGFTDPYYGRRFLLPEDWAYTQIKVDKNGAVGYMNIASPLSMIRYATNKAMHNSLEIYSKSEADFDKTLDKALEPSYEKNTDNYKLAHSYLEQLEQIVITGSFKAEDAELAKMLSNPLVVQLEAQGFLKTGLERLKANPYPFLKLNDYTLNVKATEGKALIDVGADLTLLEDMNLTGNAKLAAKNNAIMLLMFAKQKSLETPKILEKSLKEYEF